LPAPPPRSTPLARLAPWALLLAAIVAGWLLVRRPADATPRPEPGDVLLSEDLPAAPVSRRLRVKMPCTLRVEVGLPAGSRAAVAIGPPQPVERSAADEPDPDAAKRWTVASGDAAHDEPVLAPGLYVLRVVPEGGTGSMRLRVRALAP
jgi:hypothetical protein